MPYFEATFQPRIIPFSVKIQSENLPSMEELSNIIYENSEKLELNKIDITLKEINLNGKDILTNTSLPKLTELAKLKESTDKKKETLAEENAKLSAEKNRLIEQTLKEFLEELKELSRYGSAGATGYYFDYIGEKCQIYHKATTNGFELSFWLPEAGYRPGKLTKLYTYGDKYWCTTESEKIKEYIAYHKKEILCKAEELIAKRLMDSIKDESIANNNQKLKEDIAILQSDNEKG